MRNEMVGILGSLPSAAGAPSSPSLAVAEVVASAAGATDAAASSRSRFKRSRRSSALSMLPDCCLLVRSGSKHTWSTTKQAERHKGRRALCSKIWFACADGRDGRLLLAQAPRLLTSRRRCRHNVKTQNVQLPLFDTGVQCDAACRCVHGVSIGLQAPQTPASTIHGPDVRGWAKFARSQLPRRVGNRRARLARCATHLLPQARSICRACQQRPQVMASGAQVKRRPPPPELSARATRYSPRPTQSCRTSW